MKYMMMVLSLYRDNQQSIRSRDIDIMKMMAISLNRDNEDDGALSLLRQPTKWGLGEIWEIETEAGSQI